VSDYFGDSLTDYDWLLEPLDEPRMLCSACAAAMPALRESGLMRVARCESCDKLTDVIPHR